jgi:hypothetical protein
LGYATFVRLRGEQDGLRGEQDDLGDEEHHSHADDGECDLVLISGGFLLPRPKER